MDTEEILEKTIETQERMLKLYGEAEVYWKKEFREAEKKAQMYKEGIEGWVRKCADFEMENNSLAGAHEGETRRSKTLFRHLEEALTRADQRGKIIDALSDDLKKALAKADLATLYAVMDKNHPLDCKCHICPNRHPKGCECDKCLDAIGLNVKEEKVDLDRNVCTCAILGHHAPCSYCTGEQG